MQEGIVISIIFILLVLSRVWKNRKAIKDMYIAGYNVMCDKFGMPPYIPKK